MGATITPTVCTLRCGDSHEKYGDPYDFVATVCLRGDRAYICGGGGRWRHEWKDAVTRALRTLGVKNVEYERLRSDGLRQRQREVNDVLVLD